MYSHTNQKDRHYYCKLNGTRARKLNPDSVCPTPYIRAAVIEPKIEELLSVRLQDDGFLGGIAEAYLEQRSQEMPIGVPDAQPSNARSKTSQRSVAGYWKHSLTEPLTAGSVTKNLPEWTRN
jgi:hypothetical protein